MWVEIKEVAGGSIMVVSNDDLHRLHQVQVDILDEIVRICKKHGLQYFLIGGTLLGAVRHKGFIPWDDDLDIGMLRDDYERFLELCETELDDAYLLDCYKTNPKYSLPFAKIRRKGTVYEEEALSQIEGIPKGIWVDIFPLDNVRRKGGFGQAIQATVVSLLSGFVLVEQRGHRPRTLKGRVARRVLSILGVEMSFRWLEKAMTFWNKSNTDFLVNLSSHYGYKKETFHKCKFFPPQKLEFEGSLYDVPNDYDHILTTVFGDYMTPPPKNQRINHRPVRIDFGDGTRAF